MCQKEKVRGRQLRAKRKEKMLKRGIEPQTFALLARRSNQLSYSSLLKPPPFPICAHRLPSHKAQTGIR